MTTITPLDIGRPVTREEQITSDRYDVELILDELHDLGPPPFRWPSAAADRYDELHRRLGFFASLYGINWPPLVGGDPR